MEEMRLGLVEARFADLIWQYEPIASGDLVRLCEQQLGWKKSTTYTVLKKLCDRGIFKNEQSIVTSCLTKEEFQARQSERFVEETFAGSLPAFIAAFTKRKKLSGRDIEEIRKMIDSYDGEEV
ncbi:MAG: BlaI/MecI/CopY family transcriptional regulator [Clostridia bacterium]|nr:BlaI/MecI/CopY family transcriptional regulator [Clostridia bacterium]